MRVGACDRRRRSVSPSSRRPPRAPTRRRSPTRPTCRGRTRRTRATSSSCSRRSRARSRRRTSTIRCEGDTDWRKLVTERGGDPNAELGYVGVDFSRRTGELRSLADFAELTGENGLPAAEEVRRRARRSRRSASSSSYKTIDGLRAARCVNGRHEARARTVVVTKVKSARRAATSATCTCARDDAGGLLGGLRRRTRTRSSRSRTRRSTWAASWVSASDGTVLGDPDSRGEGELLRHAVDAVRRAGSSAPRADDAQAIATLLLGRDLPAVQDVGATASYWSADCRPGGAMDIRAGRQDGLAVARAIRRGRARTRTGAGRRGTATGRSSSRRACGRPPRTRARPPAARRRARAASSPSATRRTADNPCSCRFPATIARMVVARPAARAAYRCVVYDGSVTRISVPEPSTGRDLELAVELLHALARPSRTCGGGARARRRRRRSRRRRPRPCGCSETSMRVGGPRRTDCSISSRMIV